MLFLTLPAAPPVTMEQLAEALAAKPCEGLEDVLVGALGSRDRAVADRAEGVVARCGRKVTGALVRGAADADAAPRAIPLLARVDPARAKEVLAGRLGQGDASTRSLVRSAVAHALTRAGDDAAWATFAATPAAAEARVDVARLLTGHYAAAGPAGATRLFEALADGAPETTYVLLPALAELTASGHPEARAALAKALVPPSAPWVRARAAELCAAAPCEGLGAATADENPRVRAAALTALAGGANPVARSHLDPAALAALAAKDPFPFVQVEAIRLLDDAPGPAAEQALVGATASRSPRARAAAAEALGGRARHGLGVGEASRSRLRALVGEEQEAGNVRAAAASALGAACDREALGVLLRVARDGALPLAEEGAIEAAIGAALALGRFDDERSRKELAALKDPNVRADLRQAVGVALSASGVCKVQGK